MQRQFFDLRLLTYYNQNYLFISKQSFTFIFCNWLGFFLLINDCFICHCFDAGSDFTPPPYCLWTCFIIMKMEFKLVISWYLVQIGRIYKYFSWYIFLINIQLNNKAFIFGQVWYIAVSAVFLNLDWSWPKLEELGGFS